MLRKLRFREGNLTKFIELVYADLGFELRSDAKARDLRVFMKFSLTLHHK